MIREENCDYDQAVRRTIGTCRGLQTSIPRRLRGGGRTGGRATLRGQGYHLRPRRSRRPALLPARGYRAPLQDLRRIQGSHGRAVEGRGRLRGAHPRGDAAQNAFAEALTDVRLVRVRKSAL